MARGRETVRYLRWPLGLAVLSAALIVGPGIAPRGQLPAPARGASVSSAPSEASHRDPGPRKSDPPKAVGRALGKAVPGMTLTLSSEGSAGPDLHLRWVQVEGPPAGLDDAAAAHPKLTVPDATGVLGFLLVASNAAGSDTARVAIPIEPRAPAAPASLLKADAGDDQVGIAGHQVTLNGVRSEPRGALGYRWVQVGGAPVRFQLSDGYIHTFVPPAPGSYRFALIVGSGSQLSEPDVVTVTVGAPAVAARATDPGVPEGTIAEFARSALASIRAGGEAADGLATAFEDVAGRMDLYRSYEDIFAELSRRIEQVLPEDAPRRALWGERLFQPLTARLIEEMRHEGLDLRAAEGWSVGLTQAQRARFADLFRAMAEGFRPAAGH